MRALPDTGTLICYGSLDDPGVSEYLESLGDLGERIDFRGTFAFDQMNKVLTDIDILVYPSTWQENCPLTVKYAIASGTWAVLADQPGILADRDNLDRVRFFEPGNASSLQDALTEVLGIVSKQGDGASASFSLKDVLVSKAVIDINDQADKLRDIYLTMIDKSEAPN